MAKSGVGQVMREFRLAKPDDSKISHLRVFLWGALAVGIVGLVFGGWLRVTSGARLADGGRAEPLEVEAQPGEAIHIGLDPLVVQGHDPLALVRAHVQRPVEGIEFVDAKLGLPGGEVLEVVRGPLDIRRYPLRPVEDAVIDPAATDGLYPIVTFRAAAPGRYQLPEVVLVYTSGNDQQAALFEVNTELAVAPAG
ncbi:MAG: hypothetical protein ACKVWR_12830 [Acidimicrobiales bacterium]